MITWLVSFLCCRFSLIVSSHSEQILVIRKYLWINDALSYYFILCICHKAIEKALRGCNPCKKEGDEPKAKS